MKGRILFTGIFINCDFRLLRPEISSSKSHGRNNLPNLATPKINGSKPNTEFSPDKIDSPNWTIVNKWANDNNIIDCFLSVENYTTYNKKTKINISHSSGYKNGSQRFKTAVLTWITKNFNPYKFVSILAIRYLRWHVLGDHFIFPTIINMDFTFESFSNHAIRPFLYIAYVTFYRLGGFYKIESFSQELNSSYNQACDILVQKNGLIFISRPGSGKTYLAASLARLMFSIGKVKQIAYLSTNTIIQQNLPVFYRFGFRFQANIFIEGFSFIQRYRQPKDPLKPRREIIPVFYSLPKAVPTLLILDESQIVQNSSSSTAKQLANFIFDPVNCISQIIIISTSPFDGCSINFSVLIFVLRDKVVYDKFIKDFKGWKFTMIENIPLENQLGRFEAFKPYALLVKPFIHEYFVEFKHKAIVSLVYHRMTVDQNRLALEYQAILESDQKDIKKRGIFGKLYFHIERCKSNAYVNETLGFIKQGYNVLVVSLLKEVLKTIILAIENLEIKVSYVSIDGKTSPEERLRVINSFHSNEIQVILSTYILDTGLNIAPILSGKREVAVISSISWSNIRLIQLIGRVIRLNNVSDPVIRIIYTKNSPYLQDRIRSKFSAREILQQVIYQPVRLANKLFPRTTRIYMPFLVEIAKQLKQIESQSPTTNKNETNDS